MALALRKNNPYAKGAIYPMRDGSQLLRRRPINYIPGPTDRMHLVRSDDTLSNMAYTYYQDSKFWWVIADANQIHNPFILPVGIHLRIPDIDRVKAAFI